MDRFPFSDDTASSPLRERLAGWGWLLPLLAAVAVYAVCLDNFFVWDDYIWLNRARTFGRSWRQMFRPDVCYFDPLVHLLFAADYALAGLKSGWYHAVDLALHGANAVLVYRLARQLAGHERPAVYAGILFAASFAAADAVLWPASRVDLVSTLFGLWALARFARYLQDDTPADLAWSVALFVLALGAKGTPLVLPGVMAWMLLSVRAPRGRYLCLVPFAAVAALYLVLLKSALPHAAMPPVATTLNLANPARGFAGLFLPETLLAQLNIPAVAVLLLVPVGVAGLGFLRSPGTCLLRRTGWGLLLLGLLPTVAAAGFVLATKDMNMSHLMNSASHRIYLASAGSALLGGGLLYLLESRLEWWRPRWATPLTAAVLVLAVAGGWWLVRDRNDMWRVMGERTRREVAGLLPYRGQVGPGSRVALVRFTGASGFLTPMMKVCFDRDDVSHLNPVYISFSQDLELLRSADRTFLFVRDPDGGVHDRTIPFRRMLQLNLLALQHPDDPAYRRQFDAVAVPLLREVKALIGPAEPDR